MKYFPVWESAKWSENIMSSRKATRYQDVPDDIPSQAHQTVSLLSAANLLCLNKCLDLIASLWAISYTLLLDEVGSLDRISMEAVEQWKTGSVARICQTRATFGTGQITKKMHHQLYHTLKNAFWRSLAIFRYL